MNTAVIIPAAGTGSRFGSERPKQLLCLYGKPVLAWTISAFIGQVSQCVVVTSEDIRKEVLAICDQEFADSKVDYQVVLGGATRQDSVAEGIKVLNDTIETVLVHDAARPCVPQNDIEALVSCLENHPAAILAQACSATVKQVTNEYFIIDRTIDREQIWLAQTPQGFQRKYASLLIHENISATDEAQLLSHAGIDVRIVPGAARNLKITTADDAIVAAAYLAQDQSES